MQDENRYHILKTLDRILKKSMEIHLLAALLYKIEEDIISYDYFEDLDLILEDFDYDEQRLLVHLLALMEHWQRQASLEAAHGILH